MSIPPAQHNDARLAMVAALVNLVAAARIGLAYHRIGDAVHRLRGGHDRLHPSAVDELAGIPLNFTLRDGWTSPELRAHIEDACVVGALAVKAGGVLQLGPNAYDYLAGPRALTSERDRLVSVPTELNASA
jgi:hypothetical protein